MKKYLEFEEGNSHKFWQIELDGDSFTVTYGKVGTTGQTQTKSFADEATAEKEAMKLLNSKLKKGYAEAQAPTAQAAAKKEEKTAPKPAKAEAKPEVSMRKAYWELSDGTCLIVIQHDRWFHSLRYKDGEAAEARLYGVGQLSIEDAIEDFEEETQEVANIKLRDLELEETPFADFKKTFKPLSKDFAGTLEAKLRKQFIDNMEGLFNELPPILPEPIKQNVAGQILKLVRMYEGANERAQEAEAAAADSNTKYYELDSKFWAITLDGNGFTVQFGKIGTAGQTQEKYFDDEDTAAEEAEKLIKSKTKKGYAPATPPAGMSKAATKPKTAATAVPTEAPKPKVRTLPAPAADVKGNERKVADPDDYDEESDENFDLENMRTPEVVDVKPKAAVDKPKERHPREGDTLPSYDQDAFKAACDELKKALKTGRGASMVKLLEDIKRSNPTDEQLKAVYAQATKHIFSDDVWYVSQQALDLLPIIQEAGVDIAAIVADADKDDMKPLFARIAANIGKKSVEDTVAEFFRGIADVLIKQLQEVVAAIKAGTMEKIEGKKLPEGQTGFMFDVDDPLCIYTIIDRECLARQEYDPADDLKGVVTKRYLTPIIKPQLEKLMNDGFFDEIAANGYIRISLYRDPEAIVERRIDEVLLAKKAAEVEANLAKLEKGDFTGDAVLLNKTIKLYCDPNGIIVNKDYDRILALLKRCLYSGEEAFEEKARDLLNEYDTTLKGVGNGDGYGKWRHVFISYIWDNFDYKWAKNAMKSVADWGYQPAKNTLRVWDGGAPASDADDGDTDYEETYGYGQAASMAKHRDTFTEADVFVETDTIIARAMSDGYIYIRFLEESEHGYSDALDWLNRLMAAGYSKVHDGYELRVYFLAEPVFFEEMRDLIDEYMWPANDSHAFFCKAVRYPALRDKVADFARLTLHEFDRYLDLDGEYSTVAGTFAATAVAMADVKYMDVAIQYAVETDGEHEEMASLFADVLEERWGVTPETAVAIALLKMSYDSGEDGLSDDFWKYPQNLEALTEYFSGTPMHHKEHKICRLGNALFEDAEDGLKKLKKFFKDATDPKAKSVYADFHNMLLEALDKEEGTDAKSIDYSAPVSKVERPATSSFKELPEKPQCVISMAEAKKRDYTEFAEMEYKGDTPWWAVIFAPVIITNPYIYEFYEANRVARFDLDHMCTTIYNADKVYSFKNKVALDLRGAPYQFGMMVYDKKEGAMLYGVYDYCKVVAKIGGKKIDKAKMEELRDQFMIADCPQGAPIDDLSNPAIQLMEDARGAIFDERYLRAVKKLEKITPDAGEVYDASLIVMADLMRKKGDKAALKHVYETAAKRMPQYKAYWDEKLKGL